MPRLIPTETLPRETAPLTAAIQPLKQPLAHRMLKAVQCTAVVCDPKVVEVPAHLAPHGLPELGELPLVPFLAQPLVDGDDCPPQTLLRGLTLQPHLPPATQPPIMGQAEEVKRRRALARPHRAPCMASATGEQPRLVCVEAQPELRQPEREDPHKALGIAFIFEDCQRIIGIADEFAVAPAVVFHHCGKPLVQNL